MSVPENPNPGAVEHFFDGVTHPWPRTTDYRGPRVVGRLFTCALEVVLCVAFSVWLGWTPLLFFPICWGWHAARRAQVNYRVLAPKPWAGLRAKP